MTVEDKLPQHDQTSATACRKVIIVTEQTLAFSSATTSENRNPPQPISAENVRHATYPRRARLLVISNDLNWLNEVLPLVPSDAREVDCKTHDGVDPDSLHTMAQNADLLVLLGSVAAVGASPFGPGPLPANKPLVWLPVPETCDPLADSSAIWRRGAALAMRTAIKHLRQNEPEVADQSDGSIEEPRLDTTAGELRQGGRSVRVTPTECNLLRVLLASRGTWIPASELRLRAFGPDHACHDSLIRVHVYKLRRKLGSMTAEIRSAKGRGYMFA